MASQRHIGKVTAAATGGGSFGAALAEIIVWYGAQHSVDMSPIEFAMTVVLTAVCGVIGGFLVPAEKNGRHEA